MFEFRPLRRSRQTLSKADCEDILKRRTYGVLALAGDGGYPYAVPISYAYAPEENCIYFHCAKAGHKLDAIDRESKVSFCVVDQDEILPEKFTTCFRSVIVFGQMERVEDEMQKRQGIETLAWKYSPDESEEAVRHEIDSTWNRLCVLRLKIEHLSGKEAIELVRARNNDTQTV